MRTLLAGLALSLFAACALPSADYEASLDASTDAASGIELAPALFDLAEGQSADVTVRLTTVGAADVTVNLAAAAGLALDANQVVLGAATPMVVLHVTALDDEDAQSVDATITANADGFAATTATAHVIDDDHVWIHSDFDQVNISDTTSARIHVSLEAKPQSDITVRVGVGDATIASVSQASLTFTPGDWNQPQPVDVVGIHDVDAISESTSLQLRADGLPDKDVVIDVTDIDMLNVVGSPNMITVREEAPGTPFEVHLTQQPEADVTVTVQPMNDAVHVSETQITFTTSNYGMPHNLTVTASGDDDTAGYTTTIHLSAPPTATTPALAYDVSVTVDDDDVQVLQLVAANPFTVVEEQTASFTARLAFRPAADMTVMVAGDPLLTSVAPGSLNFHTNDWNQPQPVVVTALPDLDIANETTTITLSHPLLPTVDLTTTITDNDTLALVVPTPPTMINEGTTATVMVSLNYQPNAPLDVTVQSNNPALSVPAAPLHFLPATYNTAQPVVLTANTDANLANETVNVTLSSPGNVLDRVLPITVIDQTPLTLVLTTTTVAVTEEGPASQVLGVSLSNQPLGTINVTIQPSAPDVQVTPSLQFSPGDWMTPKTVSIAALTDDDVANETAMVTVSSPGNTPARTVTVNITDDDTQAILAPGPVNVVEGGTAPVGVRLAFRPAADVIVTPSSPTPAVATVPATPLTFTTSNWSTSQPVNVTGVQDVDTNPNTGTVRFTSGAMTTNVTVNVTDDDTQGIVVTGAPTTVLEGSGATFQVKLQAMPPGPVTVNVSSNNPALVVLTAPLMFTTSNWGSPQPVNLSAPVDSNLLDENVTITLSSPGNAPDVTLPVLVDDQDVLAIVTSVSTVNITEHGAGASVGVSLNKQPNGAVTVTHMSNSGLATTSGTLSFGPTDWSTPKPLTISPVTDDDTAGGTATITLSAAPVPTPATITANVTDPDVQAIVQDAPATIVTAEDALPANDARFHVHLAYRPSGNVTVNVQSLNTAIATVSTNMLTFTTGNWSGDQLVVVHGVTDLNLIGNTTTVRLTGPNMVDLPVSVTDDDTQSVITSPTSLVFTEGTTATLMVKLAFQPTTATTTVTLASNNADITVPGTVPFTNSNYGSFQSVTVTALADADTAADLGTITLGNSDAPSPTSVGVTVNDPTIIEQPGWPSAFASSAMLGPGTVMAYRITVPTTTTIDKFGLIASAVGGDFRMALYDDVGNLPSSLRYQIATRQTISSAGVRETDIVDGPLAAGNYWVAIRVSPSASIANSGVGMTATRCIRNVNIPVLDDPWPATYGTSTCGAASIFNFYLVTYRNP